MNLVTTILPFLHGCKSFIILWGGREIKINCMHIESLFFRGNVQVIRKCKTGYPVNHKQLTNAPRHAIMFLWACFTTHSLRCLSFWKLVIRLTVQSNTWISVQLAMKSQLSWSLLFCLFCPGRYPKAFSPHAAIPQHAATREVLLRSGMGLMQRCVPGSSVCPAQPPLPGDRPFWLLELEMNHGCVLLRSPGPLPTFWRCPAAVRCHWLEPGRVSVGHSCRGVGSQQGCRLPGGSTCFLFHVGFACWKQGG